MAITGTFVADFASFYTAVQKAEVSLRSFESGAGRVEGALNKMVDSLSGRRALQDATLMTEAVGRIGGVARLTTAEQERLNVTLTQALAKYKALGMEAPAAMVALQQATAGVGDPMRRASTAMDLFKGQVAAVGTAVGSFFGTLGAQAVLSFGGYVADLAKQGAAMEPLVRSFNALTRSIGETGDEMLRVSRTATRGLITDLDLMQASNKAILLGLPVTANEMGVLGNAAIALGKAMGLEAPQALDNLITALGRSSPLILDNLGLTVDVTAANAAYAATIGKTAAALTEGDKKLAFYHAAMAVAKQRTDELGASSLTAAERVSQLQTSWENFVHGVGQRSAQLVGALANAVVGVDDMSNSFQDAKAGGGPIVPEHVEIARQAKESYDRVRESVENMIATNIRARELKPIVLSPEEQKQIEENLTKQAKAKIAQAETNIAYDKLMREVAEETSMAIFNADAARLKAQEDNERAYRALQNQIAEEYLKLEGARLQKEAEKHAAALAKKKKQLMDFWQFELGGGMAIIGAPLEPGMSELARPQSLLTAAPLAQRGVAIYAGRSGAEVPTLPGATLPTYTPRMNPGININVNVGNFIGGDRAGAEQLGRLVGNQFIRGSGIKIPGT